MAPRKNNVKKPTTAKKVQEKKSNKKQFKSILSSPTRMTIKIPRSTISDTKMSVPKTPKLTKKQIKAMEKLELANEVATAQLVKKKPVNFVPEETQKVKLPVKRIRKKKTESEDLPSSSPVSDDAFEASPVKKKVKKETLNLKITKPASAKTTNVKKSLSLSLKKTKKTENVLEKKPPRKKISATKKKVPSKQLNTNSLNQKNIEKGKTNTEDLPPIDNNTHEVDVKMPLEVLEILPGPVDSRKTSLNSEFSWTKDISSSSTTTLHTVCSTDFVRIDNKIPVIKLDNIGAMVGLKQNNGMSSSSSDSSSEDGEISDTESTPEVELQSLCLSTFSLSPTPNDKNEFENSSVKDEIDKNAKLIENVASKLKTFDTEINKWIGYGNDENNVNNIRFQRRLQLLNVENEMIKDCQVLNMLLNNDSLDDSNDKVLKTNDCNSNEVNKSHDIVAREDFVEGKVSRVNKKSSDEQNNFTDRFRYKPVDQSYDDDDALSLFAESITSIDTSRHANRSHNLYQNEEYVPQPVQYEDIRKPVQKITYIPSKILNMDKINEAKTITVCEKQNADSTSIKDPEQDKFSSEPPNKPLKPALMSSPVAVIQKFDYTLNNEQPRLIAHSYKQPSGRRSAVLRGICFFNLLSSCKNFNSECRFPHEVPTLDEMSTKLSRLSEENFIQEYMLFREWPTLRRLYGMCFVAECNRRELTRVLVEMAVDFTMKAATNMREDAKLKDEVVELVLLHLSNVDLDTCEDLLMHPLYQAYLCDHLMQAIANTQNFSRFKIVFMKLTDFIMRHHADFDFDSATQIMERLSILPCEKPLLTSLLEVVKHTDREILKNPMMGHFEKQLLVHNELYEQLLELKKDENVRPVESPRVIETEPMMSSLVALEREKRYTSPDTTNLDNLNKASDDPPVPPMTQTVEFKRTNLFPPMLACSSNSSNESEKNVPSYASWRSKSIFDNIRAITSLRGSPSVRASLSFRGSPIMRGNMRVRGLPAMVHIPRLMRHRGFGASRPNFLRRPKPDYY